MEKDLIVVKKNSCIHAADTFVIVESSSKIPKLKTFFGIELEIIGWV